MDTLMAHEWRVMVCLDTGRIAITNRTYSSEENADRAASRLQACDDNLDNTYVAIRCRVMADI